MRKIIILLVLTIILPILNPIRASDFEIEKINTKINLQEDNSAIFSIDLEVKNSSSTQLIRNLDLSLPFNNPLEITAQKDNSNISTKIDKKDKNVLLSLNFQDSPIFTNSTSQINIKFKITKFLHRYENTARELFLEKISTPQKVNFFTTQIYFPKSFSLPSFSTIDYNTVEVSENEYYINVNSNRKIYMMWGNVLRQDIYSNFDLVNDLDEEVESVYQIIPETSNQSVVYKSITESNIGIADKYANIFGKINLEPKEVKTINIEARIEKNTDLFLDEAINYKINLDTNYNVAKEIVEQIHAEDKNDFEKVRLVNEIIKEKFTPEQSINVDKDSLENLNLNKKNFHELDYALTASWALNQLEIKHVIAYGYLFTDKLTNFKLDEVHVWIVFELDGKSLILDPFLDDVTSMSYSFNNELDRLRMGIWNPDNQFDNLLGLIGNSEYVSRGVKIDLGEFVDEERSLITSLNLGSEGKSGFPIDGNIKFKNETNKYLIVDKININSQEWKFKGDYRPVVLPSMINKLEIYGVRDPNFSYEGDKNFKLNINYMNDDIQSSTNTYVNLKPAKDFWILVFAIVNLLFVFCLVVLFRNRVYLRLLLTSR